MGRSGRVHLAGAIKDTYAREYDWCVTEDRTGVSWTPVTPVSAQVHPGDERRPHLAAAGPGAKAS
jgi:hypothetical protein